MGGRILLKLLDSFPEVAAPAPAGVRVDADTPGHTLRVATLDTMPGHFNYATKDSDQDGVSRVLRFVAALPSSVPSRAWLQQQCMEAGFSKGMAQWMGTNLSPELTGSGLRLSFDVGAVKQLLESHHSSDQWHVLRGPPAGCELHAVLATRSSRWRDADVLQQLDAVRGGAGKGAAHLHWLEGGHWLHVDNTAGLQRWLGEHLLIA